MNKFLFLVLLVLLISACSQDTPTPNIIKIEVTATPRPTSTYTLTPTSSPTSTPTETATLYPSRTPTKTRTFTPYPTFALAPTITKAQVASTKPPVANTKAPVSTSQPAPTKPPSTSDYKIIEFTKTVKKGGNAKVVIEVASGPGTTCFLSYVTPAGTNSSAQGLGTKTADAKSRCSWKWKIGPSTKPGTGAVYITVGGVQRYYPITIK